MDRKPGLAEESPGHSSRRPRAHLFEGFGLGRRSARSYRFQLALRRMNERRTGELGLPEESPRGWSIAAPPVSSHVRRLDLPMGESTQVEGGQMGSVGA
jgi:hypothetical protein